LGARFALDDAFADLPKHRESFERVVGAGHDLLLFVQMNRLYLPEKVCISVEALAGTITESARNVQTLATTLGADWEPSPEQRDFRTKRFHRAWEVFDKDVPAMRRLLEKEFRELLGGSSDDDGTVSARNSNLQVNENAGA